MKPVTNWLQLYLVLDPDTCLGSPRETASSAIAAGVTCLQLRWKSATDRELLSLATDLAGECRQANIPFIVNDRIDIAFAAGANGVHVGVDDLPVDVARRIGGTGFLVGYSPETDAQLGAAEHLGATYLGIGPFAATSTKADAGQPLGATEFRRRRSLTRLPVVAIGGITAANARHALAAGADGVAVASAIAGSEDPATSTHRLLEAATSDC